VIVTLRAGADPGRVQRELAALGLWATRLEASSGIVFRIEPQSAAVEHALVLALDGVLDVARAPSAHPRLDAAPKNVEVLGRAVGVGLRPLVCAGPCAVESEAQIFRLARAMQGAGAEWLRGGAFKPRTSPYAFQGHGERALGWLREAADENQLAVVTEVMSPEQAPLVARFADVLQVGSRSMQNFSLLRAVGAERKPVLLKRGMAASIEEWLLAAEHLLAAGAGGVLLCERGVRGFDPSLRNLLDLGAVALLGTVYGLPVLVDPSHASGRRDLVAPLARAAIAAGAAGIIVESHDDPGNALSDGPQALTPSALAALVVELRGDSR
jgi:3-deoxy-7-phosphoheptulonate synthase